LRVALYVFDLDGTLVDSRRDLAESANVLLQQYGGAPRSEEEIGRMVGDGAAVLVARVFAAAAIPPPPDALARFLAIYGERLLHHTRVYPGMIEVLETLRARAPLAVLTNKPLASTRRVLAGLDLARFFPEPIVIGGDGPFPRKPDPGGLCHLAALAHAPIASTLLVGDSKIDFCTARNGGARVCLARYGFGFETVPPSDVAAADCVIDAPASLVDV
jgi:phosphoglycolate phosphatase